MRSVSINGRTDIEYGETITCTDTEHSRSIEIELDEFDGVFRVVIKHDPENKALWYHFDFDDEIRLDQFLTQKGFDGLKRTALERIV